MADIVTARVGPVLTVRLNRPDRLNAFSEEMLRGLIAALMEAAADRSVRVVVLSGEGRAFCAGGDVKLMGSGTTPETVYEHINVLVETVQAMTSLEKPIIAAVHGVAAGAGFNLALASDLVVASEDARFIMSFVHVGLIFDGGGLWLLTRAVGPHRARELFFLGEPLGASEAHQWGIVNRVVPVADLENSVMELAHTLAHRSRGPLAQFKRLVGLSTQVSLQDLMRQEQITQAVMAASSDHREGVQAFLEKRPPQFD